MLILLSIFWFILWMSHHARVGPKPWIRLRTERRSSYNGGALKLRVLAVGVLAASLSAL